LTKVPFGFTKVPFGFTKHKKSRIKNA